MTECSYCRLPIGDGWHSPDWCMDWAGPERIIRISAASSMFRSPTAAAEPALDRRRIEPCSLCGRRAAVPGRVLCGPCARAGS